ncbi:MAG: acyl carrier protein [Candidatus Margulisbacteria bacterium]|nr:acyl carrier protein [Candidatus Margulisiibacteriota bacterium]
MINNKSQIPNSNLQLAKEIKMIVAKILKVPEEKIREDANLFADLGVDSLLGVEIFAALDKKYNLNVPEEKVKDVVTVKDLINLVQGLLAKQ